MRSDYISNSVGDAQEKLLYQKYATTPHTDHTKSNFKSHIPQPEPLFLNNIKPQQARDFLLSRILKNNEENPISAFKTTKPYTNNSSAQATINNIVNTLRNDHFDSNSPNHSIATMKNITQHSIRETKNALNHINGLTDNIDHELNIILENVTNILESMGQPIPDAIESQASQQRSNSHTTFEIETAEGDILTIDLAKSLTNIFGSQFQEESTITYSFTGKLNDNGISAVDNLIKKIANTAVQYDKGNIKASLQLAHNLKLDEESLKAFDFNTQSSEQHKAIDLYETTQTINKVPNPIGSAPTTQTSAFGDIIEILSNATHEAQLKEPLRQVKNIFENFFDIYREYNNQKETNTNTTSQLDTTA